LKIAFAIDFFAITGGIIVILEHAARLKNFGHDVYVLTKREIPRQRMFWVNEAIDLNWSTYKKATTIPFDIAIATCWTSCYNLHRISARKYAYFNQAIESKFYSEKKRIEKNKADSTYLLGLNTITEATWIKNYLKQNFGINASLVLNGIRKERFTTEGKACCPRENGKLRVLVEGSIKAPHKNVKRTLRICRQSLADEVWLLTSTNIYRKRFHGADRVFSNISQAKVPEIYRSCDVLVKLSYVEGMFGPPLEMFHCGGTAIVYNVTGYDEYIVHDENALVAQMGDEAAVLSYINSLKTNRALLSRLKKEAVATAAKWHDWEESSQQFEKALMKADQSPSPTPQQLKMKTEIIEEWHKIAEARIMGQLRKTYSGIIRLAKLSIHRIFNFIAPGGSGK